MNDFVRDIPFIELMLVFIILGLGSLGFFSLQRRRNPSNAMKYGSTVKWILAGLIGLAFLAIILLFVETLALA